MFGVGKLKEAVGMLEEKENCDHKKARKETIRKLEPNN